MSRAANPALVSLLLTVAALTFLGGCGGGGIGVLMPQGASEPLDIEIRNLIRRWIEEGAER